MNYSKTLAIFTESSYKIGTGHLIESLHLAQMAERNGFQVNLWVSKESHVPILKRFGLPYIFYSSFSDKGELKRISRRLDKDDCKVIIFNQRKVGNDTLSQLRSDGMKIICIDELGNRRIDCEIIINPSLVAKYHKYSFSRFNQKFYTGPEYLSMSPNLRRAHEVKRVFKDRIRAISVCMGGVDKPALTLKIISTLSNRMPDVKKNIILGGGFRNIAALYREIKTSKLNNFQIHWNINNVESLFLDSDLAFSAGGNTLYELACAGTPAIVLYDDEHEKENAIAFRKHGFGFCLGKGTDAREKDIIGTLKKFQDKKLRQRHCFNGKSIVDAKGINRILNIIKGLIGNDDKPV